MKNPKSKIQNPKLAARKFWFAILTFAFLVLSFYCYAAPASSDDLIQNAKEYDGREVVFQGEVIGDIMKRGDFYWINIKDGKKAIGVFFDAPVPVDIIFTPLDSKHLTGFTGDYGHIGDIVEIKGVFHRSCLEHGGDLDIHASYLSKIKNGYKISHIVDRGKVKAVLWLAGILFVLIVAAIYKKAVS